MYFTHQIVVVQSIFFMFFDAGEEHIHDERFPLPTSPHR